MSDCTSWGPGSFWGTELNFVEHSPGRLVLSSLGTKNIYAHIGTEGDRFVMRPGSATSDSGVRFYDAPSRLEAR